ncbi:hypothetical protein PC112_g17151 [Phytophthora cactorum]|nr:hypothetical protein PC112_g17151 [Phytophthora cactorum]
MIAPDTACVVVGESGGVPEYAEVVNEASAVCETKDEDVNTIDNGDACQKQCYDEEGVEYGNGSYVTSNYYPMDEYVNEYGTSYGCGEHNVGRYGTPRRRLVWSRAALLWSTRMRWRMATRTTEVCDRFIGMESSAME